VVNLQPQQTLSRLDPRRRLTLVVIAEGYEPTATGESLFEADWQALRTALFKIDPFGVLKARPELWTTYLWFSRETSSPVGSTFDGTTLELSTTQLLSVLNELTLADPDSDAAGLSLTEDVLLASGANLLQQVLPVVLVKTPGSGTPTATEFRDTEDETCPYFIATHAGAANAIFVAKAIGRVFSLGDEGTNAAYLSNLDGTAEHPNLLYINDAEAAAEGVAHPDYRWTRFQTVAQAQQAGEPTPGLISGGGGKTQHVYRFAPHCLMRLPIGAPASAMDEEDKNGFCVVCYQHLFAAISGLPLAGQRPKTIDKQRLYFDDAQFTVLEDLPFTAGQSFPSPAPSIPYWQYTVDGSSGLKLSAITLRLEILCHGTLMAFTQKVLESIEFSPLEVTLKDVGKVPIPLSSAIEQSLIRGTDPVGDPAVQEGVKYTAIVPVTQDASGAPLANGCLIRIELAAVFRLAQTDFDPPGSVKAMKMYPQISFKRVSAAALASPPPGNWSAQIESFHGEIRQVVDIDTPQEIADHMAQMFTDKYTGVSDPPAYVPLDILGPMPSGINYASFFTDAANANRFAMDLATHMAAPRLPTTDHLGAPLGAWMAIFDATGLDQAAPTTIVAVAGPQDLSRHSVHRESSYSWPTTGAWSGLSRTIHKDPSQGDYDNIHIHGAMGTTYYFQQAVPSELNRVMAPGCAHSCLHLHWRWGTGSFLSSGLAGVGSMGQWAVQVATFLMLDMLVLASTEFNRETDGQVLAEEVAKCMAFAGYQLNAGYKGWAADVSGVLQSNTEAGRPLVPPNQHVTVSLDMPPGTTGTTLPADRKLVVYHADISTTSPYSARDPQVMFEHGQGVAIEYEADSSVGRLFRLIMFVETGDWNYLPQALHSMISSWITIGPAPYDMMIVSTEVYDVIRFIERGTDYVPGVADGSTATTGGSTLSSL
jgi:hypothetical protein